MKPITPKEAATNTLNSISPLMIQAVNECIITHLSNGVAAIEQSTIINRFNELSAEPFVFSKNRQWLDFEPLFEKAGWEVEYDKPAYNESYESKFTFKSKKS